MALPNREELRAFRLEHKLSADQMARLLGFWTHTGYDHVLRLENGERNLTPTLRLLLAAYIDGWRGKNWPTNGEGADALPRTPEAQE